MTSRLSKDHRQRQKVKRKLSDVCVHQRDPLQKKKKKKIRLYIDYIFVPKELVLGW